MEKYSGRNHPSPLKNYRRAQTSMSKILPESSLNEPPTTAQLQSIRRAIKILNSGGPPYVDLLEPDMPSNRWEARNLQYDLWFQIRAKNKL